MKYAVPCHNCWHRSWGFHWLLKMLNLHVLSAKNALLYMKIVSEFIKIFTHA